MDSISDFLKKLCISAKEKEVQKILDQIPDQSTKEQYFYNWLTEEYNLLGGMKEKQDFLFDDDRNLKVNIQEPLLHKIESKTELWETPENLVMGSNKLYKTVDFLARSISVQFDYVNIRTDITFYERINTDCNWHEVKKYIDIDAFTIYTTNLSGVHCIQLKVDIYQTPLGKTYGFCYISNFFFKKNPISDIIFAPSWDDIIDIGASKNVLYDKINTMDTLIDANTTQTEVETIIDAEIVDGQSIDNAIDTLIAQEPHSVWRTPEPTAWDFNEDDNDFSTIGDIANTWYDLDLSSIVPVGTTMVKIRVMIMDDAADSTFMLRKNGQTSTFQIVQARTQVANQMIPFILDVGVDSDRKIEFNCNPKASEITTIRFLIIAYK